ncbi:MAG: hypothetical protein ACKOEC_05540, partial [Acidimicrobiia bacterium]
METVGLSAIESALVVDDERIAAEEIRARLVRLHVSSVGIESDGERALEHARLARPDIVLMSSELGGRLDGGTVLLVEDDPDVCEFASAAIGN